MGQSPSEAKNSKHLEEFKIRRKNWALKSCPTKICKLFIKAFKVALTMYTLICHLLDYLLKISIQTFELPLCVKHASVILGWYDIYCKSPSIW